MIQHGYTARPIRPVGERFLLENRLYQGCPSIACTKKGRLWMGWYSGGSREPSLLNYNIVTTSDDQGQSWQERFVLTGAPNQMIQALDVELFIDPRGRLWCCWVQRDWHLHKNQEGHLNQWAVVCDNPDADEPLFGPPRLLGEGFMRCAPSFLSNGHWLFPAYNWRHDHYAYLESADEGMSFTGKQGPCKIPTNFDEAMFLESQDQKTLYLLARTTCGALAKATSSDFGQTWSEARLDETLPDPSSRFWWKRLPSGRILMIKNDSANSRIAMSAMLSEDEGQSWCAKLLLEPRECSYPEAALAPDGQLFITYDHGRCSDKEILLSSVTEADILAGKLISKESFLSRIVSKAPAEPAIGNWYREALALYDEKTIPNPMG